MVEDLNIDVFFPQTITTIGRQKSLTSIIQHKEHSIALLNNDVIALEDEEYLEENSNCTIYNLQGCSLVINAGSTEIEKRGKSLLSTGTTAHVVIEANL